MHKVCAVAAYLAPQWYTGWLLVKVLHPT